MRRGFSLVEMSIVLVIIGLIVGGVMIGQNLIVAARMKTVGTDMVRYKDLATQFRERYYAWPGDFNGASIWGLSNATFNTCDTIATTNGTTQTCNGDGDDRIELDADTSSSANNMVESARAFQHLSNAGLMDGQFSGVMNGGSLSTARAYVDFPAGPIDGSFYFYDYIDNSSGSDSSVWRLPIGNIIHLYLSSGAATPKQIKEIDIKMDDGLPGKGRFMVRNWDECTNAANNAQHSIAIYDLVNPVGEACNAFYLIDPR